MREVDIEASLAGLRGCAPCALRPAAFARTRKGVGGSAPKAVAALSRGSRLKRGRGGSPETRRASRRLEAERTPTKGAGEARSGRSGWRQRAALNYDPVYSPDGIELAFASNMTGGYQIYRLRLSDGKPYRVTSGPGEAREPDYGRRDRRRHAAT
jgi:WD40 repeat protein